VNYQKERNIEFEIVGREGSQSAAKVLQTARRKPRRTYQETRLTWISEMISKLGRNFAKSAEDPEGALRRYRDVGCAADSPRWSKPGASSRLFWREAAGDPC